VAGWSRSAFSRGGVSQTDFAQFVRDDHARWRDIVKHAGVEPQ
jgi:hypothetical protein